MSKVIRGLSAQEFRPFEFDSFDHQEKIAKNDKKPVIEEAFQEDLQNSQAPGKSQVAGNVSDEIEEAFQKGKAEGLRESEESLNSAVKALGMALEEISQLRKTIIRNSSQDMLHLVLTIARQVLHCEVAVKPETILSSIERALSASISSDSYIVKVSPQDLELVIEKKPFFLARVTGLKNINFESDDTISRGGCRVESELGEVDATIETQLEEIRQYLLDSIMG
ncbi:MAG: flagellar assembly protein FliH [Deltaproteobacteria bacterium]|nr:flagellar assembly protein FliH [Deltaproteobacteria bacterium]